MALPLPKTMTATARTIAQAIKEKIARKNNFQGAVRVYLVQVIFNSEARPPLQNSKYQ